MKLKLFIILILVLSSISSQTISEYHQLFSNFEKNRYIYETSYILEECESYFEKFPFSDSVGVVIDFYVKNGWNSELLDAEKSVVMLLKGAIVYDLNSTSENAKQLLNNIIDKTGGLFGIGSLSEEQEARISKYFQNPSKNLSIKDRAFEFVEKLYEIRDNNIAEEIIAELKWYINIFGASNKIDTVRFWLGQLHSLNGNHLRASGNFLAVANLNKTGPLATTATLMAADELRESPNWKYEKAASILLWYMKTFPQNEWKPALEKLTTYSLNDLSQPEEAAEYCKTLINLFPSNYVLDKEVMEELLGKFISEDQRSYAANLSKTYVSKYPDDSFADEVQKYLLSLDSEDDK